MLANRGLSEEERKAILKQYTSVLSSFVLNFKEEVEAKDIRVKVKRRWCELTGDVLSLFHSFRRSKVKEMIRLVPEEVAIVSSPYYMRNGSTTGEEEGIALLVKGRGVFVIRAESFPEQERWERMIRARLMEEGVFKTIGYYTQM